MGVHIFTKIKNKDGWKKKKMYFSVILFQEFFRKCSMFHRNIPLRGCDL